MGAIPDSISTLLYLRCLRDICTQIQSLDIGCLGAKLSRKRRGRREGMRGWGPSPGEGSTFKEPATAKMTGHQETKD